jgi:hypothetical protein
MSLAWVLMLIILLAVPLDLENGIPEALAPWGSKNDGNKFYGFCGKLNEEFISYTYIF